MHPLEKKIETFIAKEQLLDKGSTYLVALSGGADSTCLLRVMGALGYSVEAVHCNFHLRGEESDRDEAFCRRLCEERGIELHVAPFSTRAYAKEKKISIEMGAREQRYTLFDELIKSRGLAGVVVAHHLNDAVETFMLNLIRGTGLEGLKGISAKKGHILRPLLAVRREEIISYLKDIGQEYVFDSSNAELEAQRNIIRLQLMPILKELNPSAEESITRTLSLVSSSLDLLRESIEEAKKRVALLSEKGESISIPLLLNEKSAELILWEIVKDKGFTPMQVEQIFDNIHTQTGKQWRSPTHSLLINRDALLIEPRAEGADERLTIPAEGTYIYNNVETFTLKSVEIDNSFKVLKAAESVSVDADEVAFPLTIRRIHEGDMFVPFGMKGSKLLSDYLTDCKVSLFDKQRQAVLVDREGRIVWVVGRRIDNRCAITKSSQRALIITRRLIGD